jgi:hypothetical protein
MASTYSDELKAQVIAEWMAGASQKQLVAAYHVPQTTIRSWIAGHDRVVIAPSAAPKKAEPYDLDRMAVDLVDGSVRAVTAIFGVTADDTWLKRQNAADLAVLAGVISDKLYRLLGAIQPSSGPDSAVPAGD